MTHTHLWKSLAFATACAAASSACAVDDNADLGTAADEILGGSAASDAKLNAVGALGVADGHGRYKPFCTGTLIAPTQVLTSERCADRYPANKVAFLVGPKATQPQQTIRVKGSAAEETITGGVTRLGSDVALVHLRSAVAGVEPFAVAKLTPDLVGKRFDVIGYGVRDDHGRRDVRYKGSMQLEGIGGEHYGKHLLAGVEAWLGGDNDDADLCDGDEGGPAVRTVAGKRTVFGVASWFPEHCFGGAVYSIVNDAVDTLIARETACPLIPAEGTCDGDVAVRCSDPNEGAFRVLRNDCAELLQTCAVDASLDTVTCVDPS